MDMETNDPIQLFKQLQGRVFHTIKNIGGTNYMHRYRIGSDGKLTLEKTLMGAYLSGKEVQNIIKEAGNEVRFLNEVVLIVLRQAAIFIFGILCLNCSLVY